MYILSNKNYLFVLCITSLLVDFCSCKPHQKFEANNFLLKSNDIYERLNDDIKPFKYLIDVTPYFPNHNPEKAFTFDGYSQIEFQPTRSDVTEITLHMRDFSNITHNLNAKSSSQSPSIKYATYNNVTQKYTMFLTGPMNSYDIYTLAFEYVGKLQTVTDGFYRDSYIENNVTK